MKQALGSVLQEAAGNTCCLKTTVYSLDQSFFDQDQTFLTVSCEF